MINPLRKAWQNWRGTKGEEPTPLIVSESRQSYLWIIFLITWTILGFFILVIWNPLEGQAAEWVGDEWVLYLILMFGATFPYPLYRVTKDTIYTKTDQATYQLDRTTMADCGVKGTMTVGLNKEKKVTAENPASSMITLNIYQRGGFREFGIKGDPEDGFIACPEGDMVDLGHTKLFKTHLHRYLIEDVPEPFQSEIKNKTLARDHHFVDLGFEPMFLLVKPEDTGPVIASMDETWNILTTIEKKLNGGDFGTAFEKAKDNMKFIKKILQNTEAGKPKFNAHYLIKEQQREIKKLKAEKKEDWFQKRAEDRKNEPYREPET